jgi:hypothetical protein
MTIVISYSLLLLVLAYAGWLTHKIVEAVNNPKWATLPNEVIVEPKAVKETSLVHEVELLYFTPDELMTVLKREATINTYERIYDTLVDVARNGISNRN